MSVLEDFHRAVVMNSHIAKPVAHRDAQDRAIGRGRRRFGIHLAVNCELEECLPGFRDLVQRGVAVLLPVNLYQAKWSRLATGDEIDKVECAGYGLE